MADPITPPPASGPRPTDNFRRQHDELQSLAIAIAQQLVVKNLEDNAPNVRLMLAKFSGKLKVHAKMENEALYPRLLHHRDPVIRAQAKGLLDEVQKLYSTFGTYADRWCAAGAIEGNPAEFIRATMETFRLIGKRMMRENGELYPMVDAAG
jgi:hypothetical protein